MNAIMTDGEEAVTVDQNLISKRPELLKQWLEGVNTRDGGEGYEAAKSALLSK
ncbi:hypothetical protein [Sinorhizobium fredii]|uniref:hypothetical protein n=1 Tax=Rhizobium fredii TaxID=380 RepID=UPI001FCAC405|nr:hypothetical protein [Sinorhizobium fredii]WOS64281.1 hypothetical protein SFGR64A_07915 [Sinorhizobium fredii GR64]